MVFKRKDIAREHIRRRHKGEAAEAVPEKDDPEPPAAKKQKVDARQDAAPNPLTQEVGPSGQEDGPDAGPEPASPTGERLRRSPSDSESEIAHIPQPPPVSGSPGDGAILEFLREFRREVVGRLEGISTRGAPSPDLPEETGALSTGRKKTQGDILRENAWLEVDGNEMRCAACDQNVYWRSDTTGWKNSARKVQNHASKASHEKNVGGWIKRSEEKAAEGKKEKEAQVH